MRIGRRNWLGYCSRKRVPSSMSSTRPFHLATGATALIHRLGPPLRQIRKRFPKARLNITVAATEEMITGLV